MYLVKCRNLRRSWSRGGLTSTNVVYDVKIFKKRETAKDFIEKQLSGRRNCWRRYAKTGISYCGYENGDTWLDENTGETCRGNYNFEMSKVIPL